MAFKLLNTAPETLPLFMPNQVLTYGHLNDLKDFLFQQERYTRNKLIGSGIVCGLSFDWITLGANAEVIIQEGCASTSAGYLMVYTKPVENNAVVTYTHRRNYDKLNQYIPFNDGTVLGNETIYELITLGQFNAENVAPKSQLMENDRVNRVLILLYEIDPKDAAKCLDENCDDKGKTSIFTLRPLLVPIAIIDKILDANASKDFNTEEGRGWRGIDKKLQGANVNLIQVPSLFKNFVMQNMNTPAQLVALFKNQVTNGYLSSEGTKIDALLNAFPWIFSQQMASLGSAHPWMAGPPAANLGQRFATLAQNFRNNVANDNYIQYLYDYVRDVADAFNELFMKTTDLISECGGNEFQYPFHIMLGRAEANDESKKWYDENKYLQPGAKAFRYRHYFVPSPIMGTQFMLYEEVQQLLVRLIRLVDNFLVNTQNTFIKVSPSKDYENPLGIRALPYYYDKADTPSIRAVWNYESTRRNKVLQHAGYQLVTDDAAGQASLLAQDTRANDFYRIEGHVNRNVDTVAAELDTLRNEYNLPFQIAMASLQVVNNTKQVSCHFPDLDEDYNYYRDRVLGYMREYLFILEQLPTPLSQGMIVHIKNMIEILLKARCLKDFDYAAYKNNYARIFWLWVMALGAGWQGNPGDASQQFNQTLNLVNIVFFSPIYRIWYSYLYRQTLLVEIEVDGVMELAKKVTGWEHLAGVRRGETFLMVYDSPQSKNVIADFNLPDLDKCSCGCKTNPCDGKSRSLVSPLEKPVIMIVDLTNNSPSGRDKAFWVANKGVYRLELESMGFYKGDSTIDKEIRITTDEQGQFPVNFLEGQWVNHIAEGNMFRVDLDPNKAKGVNGFGIYYYHLKGDFDQGLVTGLLLLGIQGKVSGNYNHIIDAIIGTKPVPSYPYAKADFRKEKVELKFPQGATTQNVSGKQVQVINTPMGNQIMIREDRDKHMYFLVSKIKKPEVVEYPFIMIANNNSVNGTFVVNIYEKGGAPPAGPVKGVVLDEKGNPVSEATVRMGKKEAYTDEKGNYSISGGKTGDVVEIEKEGFRIKRSQVKAKMEEKVVLESDPRESTEDTILKSMPLLKDWLKSVDLDSLKTFFNP